MIQWHLLYSSSYLAQLVLILRVRFPGPGSGQAFQPAKAWVSGHLLKICSGQGPLARTVYSSRGGSRQLMNMGRDNTLRNSTASLPLKPTTCSRSPLHASRFHPHAEQFHKFYYSGRRQFCPLLFLGNVLSSTFPLFLCQTHVHFTLHVTILVQSFKVQSMSPDTGCPHPLHLSCLLWLPDLAPDVECTHTCRRSAVSIYHRPQVPDRTVTV